MSQWTALAVQPADEPRARRRPRGAPSRRSSRRRGRVARVPLDAGVAADAELADPARALVGVERRRAGTPRSRVAEASTTLPPSKREPDALADRALVDGRELGELDHALAPSPRAASRRTRRPACCSGRRRRGPGAPGDRQRQVGAGADDAHRLRGVEPVGVAAHARALGVPVEEAGAEDEVRVVGERHPGVLGERLRRVEAADPAHLAAGEASARATPRTPGAASGRRSAGEDRRRRGCSPDPKIRIQRVELLARARLARRHRRRAAPPAPRSPRGCRTEPAPGRCTTSRTSGYAPLRRDQTDELLDHRPRERRGDAPSPASPAGRRASARRAAERTARRGGLRKRPYAVLLDDLAVELDPAAVPELLDHVPVDPARCSAPPICGKPVPIARWIVPSIFSSNSVFRMWRWMPGLQPIPNSPSRRAPSSVSSVAEQELLVAVGRGVDDRAALEAEAARRRPRGRGSRPDTPR